MNPEEDPARPTNARYRSSACYCTRTATASPVASVPTIPERWHRSSLRPAFSPFRFSYGLLSSFANHVEIAVAAGVRIRALTERHGGIVHFGEGLAHQAPRSVRRRANSAPRAATTPCRRAAANSPGGSSPARSRAPAWRRSPPNGRASWRRAASGRYSTGAVCPRRGKRLPIPANSRCGEPVL